MMDIAQLKQLLELMDSNQLVELEYEENGRRVKLRKAGSREPERVVVSSGLPGAVAIPGSLVGVASAPPEAVPPAAEIVDFKSPLVGTFYRAPKPDADSFANVGDDVHPEKVLCVIEAMKVMNEIKAEMTGIVREILVKNGQAVEFGESLFRIEKK